MSIDGDSLEDSVKGLAQGIAGKFKEIVGELIGDENLEERGRAEQERGEIRRERAEARSH